jgi:hypothetical protein
MTANGDTETIHRPGVASRRVAAGRLVAALLTLLLGAVAAAFSPPLGSDVMVTDASGARFIGVGRMDEQGLVLELTERRSQIRFVVVPPGGEPQSFRGALRDGRLVVEGDDGTFTDLETLLGEQERRLVVTWGDDDREGPDEAPPADRDDPSGDGDADGDDAPPPGDEPDDGADEDGEPEGGDDAGDPPGDDERPEGGEPSDEPDAGEDDADDEDDGLLPVDPPPPPSDDAPDPPLDAPDVDVDVGLP